MRGKLACIEGRCGDFRDEKCDNTKYDPYNNDSSKAKVGSPTTICGARWGRYFYFFNKGCTACTHMFDPICHSVFSSLSFSINHGYCLTMTYIITMSPNKLIFTKKKKKKKSIVDEKIF